MMLLNFNSTILEDVKQHSAALLSPKDIEVRRPCRAYENTISGCAFFNIGKLRI